MKKCGNCLIEKPVEDFAINKSKKDNLNTQCKTCHNIYKKQHYKDNKQKYIDNSSKNRIKFKLWFIEEIKSKLSCKICEESRHWVLDFHHRDPSQKDLEVSNLLNKMSKEILLEEIKKCDTLCANCHRDLHYKEKMLKFSKKL